MGLIACPDCGQSVSDAAPTCIHCGRPNPGRTATQTANPPINIYQPPSVEPSLRPDELPYFEVGLAKFVAMSVATFGIYDLYWAYQQWKRVKAREGGEISPFWRAFFAPLWGFSLFKHIRSHAVARNIAVDWESGFLGFVYLVMAALWRLPDPWWLISLASFLPLIPVVQIVSTIHDRVGTNRDRNTAFSGANIAGLVFGAIWLFLVAVGMATS